MHPIMQIPLRKLFVLWLGWAIILVAFQLLVTARFAPQRPDEVLMWTFSETTAESQDDKPTLIDPFLNQLVSWDSEFYLSIAINGYDDPAVRVVERDGTTYSLNYAFFPLYPLLIRALSLPLSVFGLTKIATATLAGWLITLAGTFAAVVALYDLARQTLDDSGALRAVFYLLIFPTAFFFAQIYTEGLFVGLAFGSLALMRRKRYLLAAFLAGFAVATRPVGVAVGFALLVQRLADEESFSPFPRRALIDGCMLAAIPAGIYLIWWSQLGAGFQFVERYFFGLSPLAIVPSFYAWRDVLPTLWGAQTTWTGLPAQSGVYYALEFAAILLGGVACYSVRNAYASLCAFSLLAWALALFSGSPHSMVRYVLVLPAIYIFLARLGNRPNFDRLWTIISLLLFGLLVTLFSFDFWVA
jgi:Gpi18-like mannosyltransferase